MAPPKRARVAADKEVTQGIEQKLIKDYKSKMVNLPKSCVAGVVIDLFQFTDDNSSGNFKVGHIFRTNSEARITFDNGEGTRKGYMKLNGPSEAIDSRFMIHEIGEQDIVEAMVLRSMRLKHDGILRPLLCANSSQLSKVVSGSTMFNQTLLGWLSSVDRNVTRDVYLREPEMNIVRYGCCALREMFDRNCTSDVLDQPTSYVMVRGRIKILPLAMRDRQPGETDQTVIRTICAGFANMLNTHFVPLWSNPEVGELIDLMQQPYVSFEAILGHPVLSSAGRRLVSYRSLNRMTPGQRAMLIARLPNLNATWKSKAWGTDLAIQSILQKQFFPNDAAGQLHFGHIVAFHYSENLRKKDRGAMRTLKVDTSDRILKNVIPLLLCKRYALEYDPAFRAAV